MKRLITLALALILTLAAVPALGEADPVIGVWYADMEEGVDSSMDDLNALRILFLVTFEADGTATSCIVFWYKDLTFQSFGPQKYATWKVAEDQVYELTSLDGSTGYAVRMGDGMYMTVSGSFMMFHKTIPMNGLTDYLPIPSDPGTVQ